MLQVFQDQRIGVVLVIAMAKQMTMTTKTTMMVTTANSYVVSIPGQVVHSC